MSPPRARERLRQRTVYFRIQQPQYLDVLGAVWSRKQPSRLQPRTIGASHVRPSPPSPRRDLRDPRHFGRRHFKSKAISDEIADLNSYFFQVLAFKFTMVFSLFFGKRTVMSPDVKDRNFKP